MKQTRLSKSISLLLTLALCASLLAVLTGCGDMYNYELLIRQGNSIESVYSLYKEEYPDATIDDFVAKYIAYESQPGEFAANRALRSAVSVHSAYAYSYKGGGFGGTQSGTSSAAGAGVIYSIDTDSGETYIITNYHVVYHVITNTAGDQILAHGMAQTVNLYTYGREYSNFTISATVVGGSMDEDIAVLKTTDDIFMDDFFEALTWTDGEGQPADKIADEEVKVGERAIACGNPEGGGISVTSGIISVASETITMYKLNNYKKTVDSRVLRVDTAINPGNSGGALYNRYGHLTGIVNAKSGDTAIENIGFAIPASIAVGIAKNVIETQEQTEPGESGLRFTLGISTEIEDIKTVWNGQYAEIQEAVRVVEVSPESPADGKLIGGSALLGKTGDILLEAKLSNRDEGIVITRSYHLREYLYHARIGSTLTLKVLRGGVETTVEVELTKYASFNAE